MQRRKSRSNENNSSLKLGTCLPSEQTVQKRKTSKLNYKSWSYENFFKDLISKSK